MKTILWISVVAGLAAQMAVAANDDGPKPASDGGSGPTAGTPKKYVPPVMRSEDPGDTVLVLLPGPAPAPAPPPKVVERPATVAAAPPAAPEASREKTPEAAMGEAESGPRPYYRRTERVYPDGFEQDTLKYFQDRIGKATSDDIAEVLGKATRQRAAFGEDQKENGTIFAFSDPTGKYKEYELDFDSNTGMLRTVFAYPLRMTWLDCRKQFGAKVTATDASKGRKFYSYADRRLDVLVGPDGKVVSLGLY